MSRVLFMLHVRQFPRNSLGISLLVAPLLVAGGARADDLYAFGSNSSGQLGLPGGNRPSPVLVPDTPFVVSTASGAGHTVTLRADGTVWAWGANARGQLGNGTTADSATPVQVLYLQSTTPRVTPPLASIIAVAAGDAHSLALDANGTVWAWGANDHGQLGTNTTKDSSVAVKVRQWSSSLAAKWPSPGVFAPTLPVLDEVIAVAAGGQHSLGLLADGTVQAWGADDQGQLGNGDNPEQHAAVAVKGLANAVAVAAGKQHSLALLADGTLRSWGDNAYGQLGNSTADDSDVPTPVGTQLGGPFPIFIPLSGIREIASGDNHCLAAGCDGLVRSWGRNDKGQLGDGTTTNHAIPVAVLDLVDVDTVSAGASHSAARRADGTVWTWGSNASGQLGGASPNTARPWQVPDLDRVSVVEAGASHTIALCSDGVGWGWGLDDELGTEGTDTPGHMTPLPLTMPNLPQPMKLDDGSAQGLALLADGTLRSWGWIWNGIGPDSGILHRASAIGGLDRVTHIGAGDSSHARRADGTVWAWGANRFGATGVPGTPHGPSDGLDMPVLVPDLTGVRDVAGGFYTSFVLKNNGTVRGCGANARGLLGVGLPDVYVYPFTAVPDLTGVKAISLGAAYALALKADGSVWMWGEMTLGEDTQTEPVRVVLPGRARAIHAGETHALAILADGTLWAWGDNADGQLGDGTQTYRSDPVQVHDLDAVKAVAAGDGSTTALRADGTVWAWGRNLDDERGLGPDYPGLVKTPQRVRNLRNASVVASTGDVAHVLAEPAILRIPDAARALRLAGGLAAVDPWDDPLELESAVPSAGRITIHDAIRIARTAAGLD